MKVGLSQQRLRGKISILNRIFRLTHRKLRTGKIVTGGIITIKDSN